MVECSKTIPLVSFPAATRTAPGTSLPLIASACDAAIESIADAPALRIGAQDDAPVQRWNKHRWHAAPRQLTTTAHEDGGQLVAHVCTW
jgi:hypothetical protein